MGYPQPELKELNDVKEVWLTLPLIASDDSGAKGDVAQNVTQNVAQNKNADRLSEVLKLISTVKTISQSEIAKRLGVSRRTINRDLDILRQTYRIEWIGSARTGY